MAMAWGREKKYRKTTHRILKGGKEENGILETSLNKNDGWRNRYVVLKTSLNLLNYSYSKYFKWLKTGIFVCELNSSWHVSFIFCNEMPSLTYKKQVRLLLSTELFIYASFFKHELWKKYLKIQVLELKTEMYNSSIICK